jgi:hypothetical protein
VTFLLTVGFACLAVGIFAVTAARRRRAHAD